MPQLRLKTDYVEMLIYKVRAILVREDTDVDDIGGNPSDDELPATLQEQPDDLSREEVVEEIQGLDPEEQAELVALMWLGRGDAEVDEWSALVAQAQERAETPTEEYLLGHPHVADHWAEGLDKLGLGGAVDEVEEI
jgi:hypothetical protein